MRSAVILAAAIAFATALYAADAATNNPYGVHTMLQDKMTEELVVKHLTWARSLTGPGGYVKQLIYPIGKETTGATDAWKMLVSECYERDLIPVLRLGGKPGGTGWLKPEADSPGDWTTMANVIKKVVSDLPKNDKWPIYIEVLNEPNLNIEWSGKADPEEYARFFVQVSKAIKSIGDSRIKVCNGALSPGGDYNNVKFVETMCEKVPEFVSAFDVWATHPYPKGIPPEMNVHDGTLDRGKYGIDLYLDELAVLEKHGRKDVKIIGTEGSYGGGPSVENADLNMRAFRDCWSKWPEVLAICPWYFSHPVNEDDATEWVPSASDTDANLLPTKAHPVYWAVYNLAKAGEATGCISGKVTEKTLGVPIAGVNVGILGVGKQATTDAAGNYILPRLTPGTCTLTADRQFYYMAAAKDLSIAAGRNTVANILMEAASSGMCLVEVTDSVTIKAIPGVAIKTAPGAQEAATDELGPAMLPALIPASYTLKLSKDGYYPVTVKDVTVEPSSSVELSVYTTEGSFPPGENLVPANLEGKPGTAVAEGWQTEDGKPHPEVFSVDDTVAFIGESSQKIEPKGTKANCVWSISDYSAAKAGKRYRIEAWCKTDKPEGEVKVVGVFLSNSLESAGTFVGAPVLKTTSGWTKVVATGVCPEMGQLKAKEGRLQVRLQAELKSGAAWFDCVWAGEDTTN